MKLFITTGSSGLPVKLPLEIKQYLRVGQSYQVCKLATDPNRWAHRNFADFIKGILLMVELIQKKWKVSLFLIMPIIFLGCSFDYAGSYNLYKSPNFTESEEKAKLIENVVRDVATCFGFIEVELPVDIKDFILFVKSNKIDSKYNALEGSNDKIRITFNKGYLADIGIRVSNVRKETDFIKAFKQELEERLAEDAHMVDLHFKKEWVLIEHK